MTDIKNKKNNAKPSGNMDKPPGQNGLNVCSPPPAQVKTKPVKRREVKLKAKRKGRNGTSRLCGGCLVIAILSGDRDVVKRYFFYMLGKGWFWNIREHYESEIEMFLDDLCSEVYLSMFKHFVNGTLSKIDYFKSYIFNTTKYQSLHEDKYLERLIRYDFLGEEENSNE